MRAFLGVLGKKQKKIVPALRRPAWSLTQEQRFTFQGAVGGSGRGDLALRCILKRRLPLILI
jgi:hypothetical protein